MNRSLIVLIACLLAAACSSGSAKSTPTSASSSTTAVHAVKVASECKHLPIAHVVDSYNGVPKLDGPSFDYSSLHIYPPIKGADGSTVTANRGTIVKNGPDGVVKLSPTRSSEYVRLAGAGDFDGDERSDVLIEVQRNGITTGAYIVLGTVPAGEHDPAVVGIPVPTPVYKSKAFAWRPVPVGDQNGDGADDVGFGPMFYSGRDVVANKDAALPPPFRTLPSPYVGLLQLEPNDPPTIVLADKVNRRLQLLNDRGDRLIVTGQPMEFTDAMNFGTRVVGSIVNGHHIAEFVNTTRSGTTAWRWDLDAPCGR